MVVVRKTLSAYPTAFFKKSHKVDISIKIKEISSIGDVNAICGGSSRNNVAVQLQSTFRYTLPSNSLVELGEFQTAMAAEDELARKIFALEERRDNIIYALTHEELSDVDILQLQAQLSIIQDEIVLLRVGKAA